MRSTGGSKTFFFPPPPLLPLLKPMAGGDRAADRGAPSFFSPFFLSSPPSHACHLLQPHQRDSRGSGRPGRSPFFFLSFPSPVSSRSGSPGGSPRGGLRGGPPFFFFFLSPTRSSEENGWRFSSPFPIGTDGKVVFFFFPPPQTIEQLEAGDARQKRVSPPPFPLIGQKKSFTGASPLFSSFPPFFSYLHQVRGDDRDRGHSLHRRMSFPFFPSLYAIVARGR